jgi:hypothetical protein
MQNQSVFPAAFLRYLVAGTKVPSRTCANRAAKYLQFQLQDARSDATAGDGAFEEDMHQAPAYRDPATLGQLLPNIFSALADISKRNLIF